MSNVNVTYSIDVTFNALADPTRRSVLDLLQRGALPAGKIAGNFPVSRPAISRHLRLLRDAKLIKEHKRGRHRYYELNPGPLIGVDQWLNHYRVFWQANLTSLKSLVESGQRGFLKQQMKKNR